MLLCMQSYLALNIKILIYICPVNMISINKNKNFSFFYYSYNHEIFYMTSFIFEKPFD